MKKNLYFILLIAPVLFTISCGKGNLPACCTAHPLVTDALKNDTSWAASGFKGAGGYQNMTVAIASINSLNKNNVNDTIVMTFNYSDSESVFKLHSGQIYYHSAVNGVVKSYQLDTLSSGNVLTVTDYEPHWDFVQGTFALKFLNPGHSDIIFSNGKFDVLIN